MSFNDPGFLFNNRTTDNEREAERLEWENRKTLSQRYYARATWLVVLTMLFVAVPTGLEQWHWHVVIGAGVLILVLALMMMLKGARQKALISLLFAAVILPGWIKIAPSVAKVVCDQTAVIAKEWKRIL